jgi:hypothetical protein
MAATLTQERFAGPEWVFERKFDGIRLLAFKQGSLVRLYSRNRLPQHLPAIAAAIGALPVAELILDGEVTWDGRTYHVFDVLWVDGRAVMSLRLEERRAALETLPLRLPLEQVERLADPDPWERAAQEGWEGVIAKRRGSAYEHRRAGALDSRGREALLKYVLRPPIANDRLGSGPGGLVRLTLKKPFADGTWAIDLDPLSLMFRLAALVPPAFSIKSAILASFPPTPPGARSSSRHLPALMAHRHRLPPRNPSLQATIVAIAHGLSFSVAVSPSTY